MVARSSRSGAAAEDNGTDRRFVGALARGLDVLRCFTTARTELGSAQVAQLTSLPQPTAWRLCYTLLKTGHLVPVPGTDKFRLGLATVSLAHAALAAVDRQQLVQQEMQQLADLSSFAVSLAMAQSHDMLIVQRAIPDSLLILNLHVGSRLPLASSAMGWAYLAALPQAKRKAVQARLGKALTPALRREIDQAARFYSDHGYVANVGSFHAEVSAIAVPIIAPSGDAAMALNCGGPSAIVPIAQLQRDVAPRLMAVCRSIGESLLHSPRSNAIRLSDLAGSYLSVP